MKIKRLNESFELVKPEEKTIDTIEVVEETLTEASENAWDKLVKAYPELTIADGSIDEELDPYERMVAANPDLDSDAYDKLKQQGRLPKVDTPPAEEKHVPALAVDVDEVPDTRDPYVKLTDMYPDLKESVSDDEEDSIREKIRVYFSGHPYPADMDTEDIAEEVAENLFDIDYNNTDPDIAYAIFSEVENYLDSITQEDRSDNIDEKWNYDDASVLSNLYVYKCNSKGEYLHDFDTEDRTPAGWTYSHEWSGKSTPIFKTAAQAKRAVKDYILGLHYEYNEKPAFDTWEEEDKDQFVNYAYLVINEDLDEDWDEYDDQYEFDNEDDVVEQDRMHAALYGGDREYCDKCGSKLVMDEWGGTCPKCNAEEVFDAKYDDDVSYFDDESIDEAKEKVSSRAKKILSPLTREEAIVRAQSLLRNNPECDGVCYGIERDFFEPYCITADEAERIGAGKQMVYVLWNRNK